jgi:hypothetical protein
LSFSIKSAGDSFLALGKLLRRPRHVDSVHTIRFGTDPSNKTPMMSSVAAAKIRADRQREAKKIPERYEQATPSWLYNLNDKAHTDALLNFLNYASAAAQGKALSHVLNWDELRPGQRYELCRTELPSLTYLNGNQNNIPVLSNSRLGIKCWEILELEAVMHCNPRSVRDEINTIDRAIVNSSSIDLTGELLRRKQEIAADAILRSCVFGTGRVTRSAALRLHMRRVVEIPQRQSRGGVEYGNEHMELPAYYILDAGELSFPLEALGNLTEDFAGWFDWVIRYHEDHPEQTERAGINFRRVLLEGLGPARSILDHDCNLDAMPEEVVKGRYEWEVRNPYRVMDGKQYRQITRWRRREEWHEFEVEQLLLGKMAYRTRRLFRKERLVEILGKAQPYLFRKFGCSTTVFTRCQDGLNRLGELPNSITDYHPEYLDRLGAWCCGEVAWDPRWPGSVKQAKADVMWVRVLVGLAKTRVAQAMALLACVCVFSRQNHAAQTHETIDWVYTGAEIKLLFPPQSRGPPGF